MSERIGVDIPATPNLVRFDSPRREQIVDVLAGALKIRHRIRDGHQRG